MIPTEAKLQLFKWASLPVTCGLQSVGHGKTRIGSKDRKRGRYARVFNDRNAEHGELFSGEVASD